MSHLLLTKHHHQLFFRNAQSRPARNVQNTAAHTNYGGLAVLVGAIAHGGPAQFVAEGTMLSRKCMLLKPLEDHQEVIFGNPNPNRIDKWQEKISINLEPFNLGPSNLNKSRNIVISVDAKVIMQRKPHSTLSTCIGNYNHFV